MNIFVCNFCNRIVIAEDRNSHKCVKVAKDLKIDDDKLLVFDGENWIPLKKEKIPKKILTKILACPDRTQINFCPDDYPEPNNVSLKYYISEGDLKWKSVHCVEKVSLPITE